MRQGWTSSRMSRRASRSGRRCTRMGMSTRRSASRRPPSVRPLPRTVPARQRAATTAWAGTRRAALPSRGAPPVADPSLPAAAPFRLVRGAAAARTRAPTKTVAAARVLVLVPVPAPVRVRVPLAPVRARPRPRARGPARRHCLPTARIGPGVTLDAAPCRRLLQRRLRSERMDADCQLIHPAQPARPRVGWIPTCGSACAITVLKAPNALARLGPALPVDLDRGGEMRNFLRRVG